jgi:hypothetical protein
VVVPESNEAISFEGQIKGLFREKDRTAMEFAFDLSDLDDVRQNAPAILDRLRDGSMPCDEPWPTDRIDLFEHWINGGMQV